MTEEPQQQSEVRNLVRNRQRNGFSVLYTDLLTVFGAHIGPNGLLTYWALMSFADNTSGNCYPSLSTIAARAQVSKSSIQRALDLLQKYYLLRIERRPPKPGSKQQWQTNVYYLEDVRDAIDAAQAAGLLTPAGGIELPPKTGPGIVTQNIRQESTIPTQNIGYSQGEHRGIVTQNIGIVSVTTKLDSSELDSKQLDSSELDTHSAACAAGGAVGLDSAKSDSALVRQHTNGVPARTLADTMPEPYLFKIFWDAYPNKQGRPAALRVWKRISPDAAEAAQIMAGLDVWRQSDEWAKDDGQFIPHPATWLNREGYNDQPRPKTKAATRRAADGSGGLQTTMQNTADRLRQKFGTIEE